MSDTLCVTYHGNSFSDEMTLVLKLAFERAMRAESLITPECLQINGMSGVRYRMFINNLIRLLIKPRYLEVGTWAGSTACAAMDRNILDLLCIDNWSLFGGPKIEFFENVKRFKSNETRFDFIEEDFRAANLSAFERFNVYLFDGPHEERDQYDGLKLYETALENNLIFIVDDWNWDYVRAGTLKAIRDTGLRIDFSIEVRTTLNNEHAAVHGQNGDWHNGYFMSKLSRSAPYY